MSYEFWGYEFSERWLYALEVQLQWKGYISEHVLHPVVARTHNSFIIKSVLVEADTWQPPREKISVIYAQEMQKL